MIDSQSNLWRRPAITYAFVAGILLPPLYVFVMVQHGAIIFPHWDHLATAKQIVQYFDGTLTFHDLIEPQSQARPLFPRLIFIFNAALTKWDVRSEYVYIYLTVYGVFIALLFALWRVSSGGLRTRVLTASLLISVIAFSPVGSHNHFWSVMLIATLAYLCAIVALLAVSIHPLSWPANIFAALLAWISAYSISQGLFLFPAIFIVHQMIAPRMFLLNRWSLFWLANLVVCYALYIPGAPLGGGPRPTLFDFLPFILVYVGNPLGSLLWFPHMGSIELPHTTIINGICGIAILAVYAFTAWRALPELSAKRPETLILFSFAVYAGACTIVTAWGRASGSHPIMSANSSRYSILRQSSCSD